MSSLEHLGEDRFPEPEPDVVHRSLDEAGPLLDVLSSETAQSIFVALCRDQATATELADRTGTTVQNVAYHLSKLTDAGLVTVVGTRYSEKGREMKVYARAVSRLVIGVCTDADGPE